LLLKVKLIVMDHFNLFSKASE